MTPTGEPQHRRILVVDDDRAIPELVSTALTLAGHHVFTARDGRAALQRIATLPMHAMVLDLNMPILDGFGVLEALAGQGMKPPPTLVLTARNQTSDVQKALQLGASDYLAKPFQTNQLLARVKRLLRPKALETSVDYEVSEVDRLLNDATDSRSVTGI